MRLTKRWRIIVKKAISFEDVRFCYGDVCAIHDVNFEIPKHTMTAIVGPNGGGKSTIIKLMSGFMKPDNGSIEIVDAAAIGYVAQGFGFDDSFPITVKEIVLTGTLSKMIKPFQRYTKEQHKKAEDAIVKVDLKDFMDRGANQLSGGQLKRVIIARALASEADILVLDEPDSNLDVESVKELYDILSSLRTTKTILVASHNIDYILGIADNAVYVNTITSSYDNPMELKGKINEGMMI